MKKITLEPICLLAVLALGAAAPASAQTLSSAAADSPSAIRPDSTYGLVGDTYSAVTLGFQKQQGAPGLLHDYEFVYNKALHKQGNWGIDGNLTYDYLTGSAFGVHDHRNLAEGGFTAYALEPLGKPFVTADAGGTWERWGNVSRKEFVYTLTAGVEVPLVRNLVLTPFAEYQAEPNHVGPPIGFSDHVWNYGVKATCRITSQWSASVTGSLDQYNRNDFGYRLGVDYHF